MLLKAASDSARRRKFWRHAGPRWTPENGGWAPGEVALLGTDHDEVIAGKVGRSRSAVVSKRLRLGVPVFRDRRGGDQRR